MRPKDWWNGWRAIPWWAQCVIAWLVVLCILTIVSLVAARIADARDDLGKGYYPRDDLRPDSVPGIWVRWDSGYYLSLAEDGYAAHPDAMGFFPLFPLLMAGLSYITGLSLAMSGMLVSQIGYLAAILCFYKLARLVQDDHAYAMRCVLCLMLFPSSFFFFAVYAESLLLALAILAVYLILRTRPLYVQSGLALGLASVARPVGWLVDSVLLIEFIKRRRFNLSSLVSFCTGLALSISGIVLFVLYTYSITGSFLAIPEATARWLRKWQYPWVTLWKSIRITVVGNSVSNDWFLYAINWVDLLFTILALLLTALAVWWSFRQRFRWSLSIYLICLLIFLLSLQGVEQVPLWGMTRWVGALFPIYLVLGNLGQRKLTWWMIVLTSASLLILFTAWWASGRWVG